MRGKMAQIKTFIIYCFIAFLAIGGFSYWGLIKENKGLILSAADAVIEYNSCITNKEDLIATVDRQNIAVKGLEKKLEIRGQLVESTKQRNAELLSSLATRLDNLYSEEKLKSCENAMDWLVDTAVRR